MKYYTFPIYEDKDCLVSKAQMLLKSENYKWTKFFPQQQNFSAKLAGKFLTRVGNTASRSAPPPSPPFVLSLDERER
jgi:hypothetical protein